VLDENQLDENKLREIHRIFAPFGQGNTSLVYLMINVKINELQVKNFMNIPDEPENASINIVFSIYEKEFTIIDYELISKRDEFF